MSKQSSFNVPSIWIELPKAKTFKEAEINCGEVNKLLRDMGLKHAYFYASNEQRYTNTFYNYVTGESGSYVELEDRGQWFSVGVLRSYLALSQKEEV
jgi:hypothetical protein|tara:strand:+ start:207 stop:497 length:291 start_codon:yes stop_codon:yes gene_type:complete